ncbi:MAG TPA: LEA type 2 family protein [Chitinophagaceae bacterium]|nr:LEA type 2 family protein [Chitinophagaceae bacterium]
MKNRFLTGICISSFLILFLCSCRTIKDPEYKGISDVYISKLDVNGPILSLRINYYNPNKRGLKMKEVRGEAWLDNSYLGHFSMDTLIKITGQSDFIVPVRLGVDMKNALKNAVAAFFDPEITLKLSGYAKIGKGGIYIRYPIHYEGKQNITEMIK